MKIKIIPADMLQPAMVLVNWYKQNQQSAISAVLKFECIQSALKVLYNYAVYHKIIEPVDKLPPEEKVRLWGLVKNTPYDSERKRLLCQDIHAMEKIATIV